MTTKDATEAAWRVPPFTSRAQRAFWEKQAGIYANADMTTDNSGELVIVRANVASLSQHAEIIEDVVTFGGAVGCRDPLVVTDILDHYRKTPQRIFFNDLSPAMVETAARENLTIYPSSTKVTLAPGRVLDVVKKVPSIPRRLLIGLYRAEALVKAFPSEGYNFSGIDEYLKNSNVVGSQLVFEVLQIKKDVGLRSLGIRALLTKETSEVRLEAVRSMLQQALKNKQVGAIRVIGTHPEKKGFFISHWFTMEGAIELMRIGFGADRINRASFDECAKGLVVSIDPIGSKPRGLVTMLNNVLGNILPDEQIPTLQALQRLTS
jgi:hypothetical protein